MSASLTRSFCFYQIVVLIFVPPSSWVDDYNLPGNAAAISQLIPRPSEADRLWRCFDCDSGRRRNGLRDGVALIEDGREGYQLPR